jgi:hypothetical protein
MPRTCEIAAFWADGDQMPTQTFSSFEAFFDAFRFANMRPMVLGPAGENWKLSTLVLDNLNIQWGQAEAKTVVEGAPRAAGISIFLPTRTPEAWWCNGRQCDELSLMVDVPGADFCLATAAAPRSWCGLYIPNHVLAVASGCVTTAVGSKRGFFSSAASADHEVSIGRWATRSDSSGSAYGLGISCWAAVSGAEIASRGPHFACCTEPSRTRTWPPRGTAKTDHSHGYGFRRTT